jgi:hypothetical protein
MAAMLLRGQMAELVALILAAAEVQAHILRTRDLGPVVQAARASSSSVTQQQHLLL